MKWAFKIFFIFTTFCCKTVHAQEFQAQAFYVSKQDMNKSVFFDTSKMTNDGKDKIAAALRKMGEKSFVLNFDTQVSIYQEEGKLDGPNGNNTSSSDDKLYKDIKNKVRMEEKELLSKAFLIVDKLEKFDWNVGTKTKKIGGYTCINATLTIKVSKGDLANFEEQKKFEEKNKTDFYKPKPPKDTEISAWFCPDIPISQGPDKYWGLPGLIFEVNDGTTILLCNKIVVNPKNKLKLQKLSKGKVVNQKQFDKIETDKYNQMKDKNGAIHLDAGN